MRKIPIAGIQAVGNNTEECVAFMNAIRDIGVLIYTLQSTFTKHQIVTVRCTLCVPPVLEARYQKNIGISHKTPLALDSVYKDQRKTPDFTASIIKNVSSCVNIAKDNFIMDQPNYNGVIYADIHGMGETWLRENNYTKYVATAEVYSDSISAHKADEAQISAIEGMENCILGNCDMN